MSYGSEERVRQAFLAQAEWGRRLDSPLTGQLCELLGRRLDRTTGVGRAVLGWEGDPRPEADALPLRLTGGLHALARRGSVPALSACYPPNPLPRPDQMWRAVVDALRVADAELQRWLERAPQTNEVGRAAVLMSGLLMVARCLERPLALFELGASAGLNLMLDRYGYDLGGTPAGDPNSPLQLAPDWKGAPPPGGDVGVAVRHGVDLAPLDVETDEDRERLIAFVWPDQAWRMEQLEGALEVCCSNPPRVEAGSAGAWLERRLPEVAAGTARVVMHSLAFQYFESEEQERVRSLIEREGAAAASDAPLAWLRFEIDPQDGRPSLRLRMWPGGEDRLLAFAHPHGRSIQWLYDE